jgi:hypothetical protein
MTKTAVRWALVALMTLHGLVHLLGVAKGLGGANVKQLKEPIGAAAGVGWLVAAVLVLAAAALLAAGARAWYVATVVAVLVSEAVIATSFTDAWMGTIPNVVLLAAAAYGYYRREPVPSGTAASLS